MLLPTTRLIALISLSLLIDTSSALPTPSAAALHNPKVRHAFVPESPLSAFRRTLRSLLHPSPRAAPTRFSTRVHSPPLAAPRNNGRFSSPPQPRHMSEHPSPSNLDAAKNPQRFLKNPKGKRGFSSPPTASPVVPAYSPASSLDSLIDDSGSFGEEPMSGTQLVKKNAVDAARRQVVVEARQAAVTRGVVARAMNAQQFVARDAARSHVTRGRRHGQGVVKPASH
ncbi:hypothetical protein RQP46_010187 [Phenoliferia psychrophenolica]